VKDHTEIAPAVSLDPSGLFLVEAVEVCVVIGFSRFDEAVVDRLALRCEAVCAQQAMSSLSQRHEFARIRFRTLERTLATDSPADEIVQSALEQFSIASLGIM